MILPIYDLSEVKTIHKNVSQPHAEACSTHLQQERGKNRPGFPRKSTKGSPLEQKFLSSKRVEETNSGAFSFIL
jgi:hypothetical protein